MTDPADTAEDKRSSMWGGRFRAGPAEAMERFNACLEDDKRLAMEDVAGSIECGVPASAAAPSGLSLRRAQASAIRLASRPSIST